MADGREQRPFTVADGMALVGATAVGLVLSTRVLARQWEDVEGTSLKTILENARNYYIAWSPLLIAWTVALVGLRLRRSRPPLRPRVHPPGVLGLLVATAVLGLVAVTGFAIILTMGVQFESKPDMVIRSFREIIPFLVTQQVGLAIAGSWAALALIGMWRPEPGWIDRLGRILCILWIVGPCIDYPVKAMREFFFAG